MITTIGFDGDDTLWHNEMLFSSTQEKFRDVLLRYTTADDIDGRLYATEVRNLALFGYGIKGFMLSMIETAIELTEGRISGSDVHRLIAFGKAMLQHKVELIDGVPGVLTQLGKSYRLILITKGDLFDQESKIARSGLAERFAAIEIVSEKDAGVYRGILDRQGVAAADFMMIGNSLRSDILPPIELGAAAVHIPYHVTWQHEAVDIADRGTHHTLSRITELPALIRRLNGGRVPAAGDTGGS